ncbi:MAG: ectonucleotide pyrophosphatase/phosphodiesterase, partial [Lachnospiraceae bacterium]
MYQEENAGKTKVQRLYLISFDACGAEDLEMMRSLPNFGRVMERAAICERVASVYPSLTYPAHTSVITGKMPKHHGVVNNTLLQPNRPTPDWMWQRKYIKGTTLYDEMLQRGWTVASLLWPVTAKSKITYNLPEVMANRPWQSQMTVSAMNGSLAYQLELNKKFGKLRDGIHQPALDHFTHASALHTIEKYHPNMMLIHYTDVDTNRHIYGVHHKKVTEAMKRHDVRLGELLQCIERTGRLDGTWQDTTIVLLGDHYQQDTTNIVYLNYLLREHGLLTTQDDRITSYRVIAKNCDGSCYLYLNAHSAIEREQIMTELET